MVTGQAGKHGCDCLLDVVVGSEANRKEDSIFDMELNFHGFFCDEPIQPCSDLAENDDRSHPFNSILPIVGS